MTVHVQETVLVDTRLWVHSGCPLCGSRDTWEFYTQKSVPTQDGVLWPTADAATHSPVGEIRLAMCFRCGYIANQTHDPAKVRFTGYDVSLQHSPMFNVFVGNLAQRLIETYNIRRKTVLDIACGKGHFLKTMCRLGENAGVGIDPSFEQDDDPENASDRITFLKEFYGPQHEGIEADLISVRHMIDIIPDPVSLLSDIRRGMKGRRDAVVYIEVPNPAHTFGRGIVWNVVYEHRSWFVPESLAYVFRRAGFGVIRSAPCWNDEYLGVEGIPTPAPGPAILPDPGSLEPVRRMLEGFAGRREAVVAEWRGRLEAIRRSGKKVAAWGAGARGITFLSMFDVGGLIPLVVDINPRRQGMYLPRTAHRVDAPERLKAERPDLVLITNPTYAGEIRRQINDLGISPEILVL